MSSVITYQACPVCGSSNIRPALEAVDYTVSKETFSIWECNGCTVRFTQQIPPASDIGRYYQSEAYISHTATKKGLVNTLYHWVRAITLAGKRKLVNRLTNMPKGALLDVGAGTGAFVHTMQKAGWEVTGLEPDETARANAQQQYQVNLAAPDGLFSLPAAHFDAITMWHVLEHVHELHRYLDTFGRILKARGTLIIAVPNYTSYDAAYYREHWAAYDVPRHLYHFSPMSMDVLAEQHGMQVVAYKPMWFDSFYVAMLSEKYKNGYQNYLAALGVGWISNWKALSDVSKCSSVIYVLRKQAFE